jgi:hypothetical protein
LPTWALGSLAYCIREVLALARLPLKSHSKVRKLLLLLLFYGLGLENVVIQRGELSCGFD